MKQRQRSVRFIAPVVESLVGVPVAELLEQDRLGQYLDLASFHSTILRLQALAERQRQRATSAEQEL